MIKNNQQVSHPYVGYVFLLISFVMLGTFVAGLALQSGTTALIGGVGLVVTLAASVFGFRLGTKKLAKAREGGDPSHNISIWSQPMGQDAIDTYLRVHRGPRAEVSQVAAVNDQGPILRSVPRDGLGDEAVAAGSDRLSA